MFPAREFFEGVYRGRAPWDIGAPQPDLMQLVEDFPPAGRILDLGTGTGDLAIGLAARGLSVLGVDFVAAAVAEARSRVLSLSLEQRDLVDFEVGDALRPTRWAGEIGSAIDSGFFHLFEGSTRQRLVGELSKTLPQGGRYYMLGFAISLPATDVPLEVTIEEVHSLFSPATGWVVRALRPASFRTNGFDSIPALALCAEREAGA